MRSKNIFLTTLLLVSVQIVVAQDSVQVKKDVDRVWDNYQLYQEASIKNRFIKHTDVLQLIQKNISSGLFMTEEIGRSIKGRSINHLTYGRGKTKVLLWSQMHGDESTATMALFDLFNFMSGNDEFDPLRRMIRDNLELHFVPMLNPDGAQEWKRRNDLEIDINRDARLLVTPEGRALMEIAKKIQPEIAFNLHDQSTLYAAGRTDKSATISFLAPAYNYPKDMNESRKRATQLILTMNDALQTRVPGNIAKYDDAFDPRCFGDTFQALGFSTILIESGGFKGDPEKQYIRKLNFYALLTALESIAQKSYVSQSLAKYDSIPENSRSLYDLVVRNVSVNKEGISFRTNLGINLSQIKGPNFASMSYNGRIEELGDMELNYGHDEIEASQLSLIPGKVKLLLKSEWDKLTQEEEFQLVKEGFLFVKWTDIKSPSGPVSARLLNLTNAETGPVKAAGIGQQAQFILTKEGKPEYAVINGFVLDLNKEMKQVPNVYGY
jgi:hypothetical protein